MDFLTVLQLLDSAMRLSAPLLLACLAGLYSERAGIFDIGLEGKMLAGAFVAAAMSATAAMPIDQGGWGMSWGAAWVGLLFGILISVVLSLVHGLASITLRGNQLISGVAINFFAAGTTVLVGQNWFRMGGQTPQLQGHARFESITLPGAETLGDSIPVIGPIYEQLISGHNLLVYVALAMVPLTWWVLNRTRFGLHLRAVGENPAAVDTAGINVVRLRYTATIICGILCGMAGAYLSLGTSAAGFLKDMSAGKGFIALAALIFAKWRPYPALGATFLFGLLDAIANKYQSLDIGLFVVPVQFMQALPYILTVVILAGFVGKAIPPKAGGEPYVKER
ncbi:ABC transporter permease [Abyssibius alkaniclasticus]|uniref:ABC transporter permease n=1 Tax=Abyssibius alkaniclasticus TaxID=2881234 RepID=UPI00405A2637